jgi:hypothetical protein
MAARTEPPSTTPAVRRRPVPSVGVQTAAPSARAIASVATPAGTAVSTNGPSPWMASAAPASAIALRKTA